VSRADADQSRLAFVHARDEDRQQALPGDRLEHEIAGYAKILCSAIFITGRSLRDRCRRGRVLRGAAREPWQSSRPVIDQVRREVSLTLPNDVTRTARLLPAGDLQRLSAPRLSGRRSPTRGAARTGSTCS
jgi:hypothetical protein